MIPLGPGSFRAGLRLSFLFHLFANHRCMSCLGIDLGGDGQAATGHRICVLLLHNHAMLHNLSI